MTENPDRNHRLVKRSTAVLIVCLFGGWAWWCAQATKAIELPELPASEDAIGTLNSRPNLIIYNVVKTLPDEYQPLNELSQETSPDAVLVRGVVSEIHHESYDGRVYGVTLSSEDANTFPVKVQFLFYGLPNEFFQIGDEIGVSGCARKTNSGQFLIFAGTLKILKEMYLRNPEMYELNNERMSWESAVGCDSPMPVPKN